MKFFSYIPSFLKNKFLLASIGFTVWVVFFDRNDLLTQIDRKNELSSLKESRAYYTQEIEKERKISEELKSDPSIIEKYAREKYLMKRDNEELFLIQKAEN